MTDSDPASPLSWSVIPMIDKDVIDGLLHAEDNLRAVTICLLSLHRDLMRLQEVSHLLEQPNRRDRAELELQLAHRVEHAWHWQERLEELLPAVVAEFAGASRAKPPRFAKITGESAVVVAAKLGRGVLGCLAELVDGREPSPLVRHEHDSPPRVSKDVARTHASSIAAWLRTTIDSLPARAIIEHVSIELSVALRARQGVSPKPKRRWRVLDAHGRPTKAALALLRSVAWHVEHQVHKPAYKQYAAEAKCGADSPRHYMPALVREGYLDRHKTWGHVLTPKGRAALASSASP